MVRNGGRGGSGPWLGASRVATAVLAAGLIGIVVFLVGQGRAKADQWASSLSMVLAYLGFAAAVVGSLARRAAGDADVGGQLRAAVRQEWIEEAGARGLDRPKPLRLRWQPTGRPVVTAGRAAAAGPAGALLQDETDTRPAATALAEQMASRELRQVVILGARGAGKTTLAALLVLATVDRPGPVPVLLSAAGWDPADRVEDWIEGRLLEAYPALATGRRRGQLRALIDAGGVMAVLDGLDEMPEAARGRAVGELDRAAGAGLPMVLTCRFDEYEAMVLEAGVLSHAAVVEIQPVSAAAEVAAVAGGSQPTIQVVHLRSGQQYLLDAPEYSVTALRISADGSTLVADGSGVIDVWRMSGDRFRVRHTFTTGDSSATVDLLVPDRPTQDLAVSPDGELVATAGRDGMVQLWDADTTDRLAVVPRRACTATAIAFSDDGARLVAGCLRTVKVWNLDDLLDAQQ